MENKKLRTPLLDEYSSQLNQKKMTARKIYRISLTENASQLAETLAILAAKSNGSEKKYSLEDLETVAKGETILYPSLNKNTTCELIGSHLLHLDRKVGESYQTVLILESVEVLDLDVPTLTRNEAKEILDGIANPENMENLN